MSTWEERMSAKAKTRLKAEAENRNSQWREEMRIRPDLPHCNRCDDGRECNCSVTYRRAPWWSKLWTNIRWPATRTMACACIGFVSCPRCHRRRSPDWIYGGSYRIEGTDMGIEFDSGWVPWNKLP